MVDKHINHERFTWERLFILGDFQVRMNRKCIKFAWQILRTSSPFLHATTQDFFCCCFRGNDYITYWNYNVVKQQRALWRQLFDACSKGIHYLPEGFINYDAQITGCRGGWNNINGNFNWSERNTIEKNCHVSTVRPTNVQQLPDKNP